MGDSGSSDQSLGGPLVSRRAGRWGCPRTRCSTSPVGTPSLWTGSHWLTCSWRPTPTWALAGLWGRRRRARPGPSMRLPRACLGKSKPIRWRMRVCCGPQPICPVGTFSEPGHRACVPVGEEPPSSPEEPIGEAVDSATLTRRAGAERKHPRRRPVPGWDAVLLPYRLRTWSGRRPVRESKGWFIERWRGLRGGSPRWRPWPEPMPPGSRALQGAPWVSLIGAVPRGDDNGPIQGGEESGAVPAVPSHKGVPAGGRQP